jgi:hypothetical protein
MRRLLFNSAAAVSLILLVAALSLWIRGALGPLRYERWRVDQTGLVSRSVSLYGYDGVVQIGVIRYDFNAPLTPEQIRRMQRVWELRPKATSRGSPPVSPFILYSFASRSAAAPGQPAQWGLSFRLWPVAVVAAVIPGLWVRRRIRQARRARMGWCLSCGYDLHATPERCPECGAVSKGRPAAA